MIDILLHSCCAPCSSAIIEWMLAHGARPTIFYSNPNIYPEEEYLIRKNEITRYAKHLGLTIIDEDTSPENGGWQAYHDCWLKEVKGLEREPERGPRCLQCFKVRLLRAARKAAELGIDTFTTTLASSRWKSLSQITEAGQWAASQVKGVSFDARNWRKGGLQQRRNELLKQNGFYNQQYCGCEFSIRPIKQKEMEITERFIHYTKFDTQSSETSTTVPSTPEKQLAFAAYLKAELQNEGLQDVEMDDKGYIYATLPANTAKDVPVIGFISHYDTSPDCSGANIKARIVSNYDGGDIVLSPGIVMTMAQFPELLRHVGEDLIVTDGTTLLGADDKAGIAEIVQAMVWLKTHPEVEHGKIRIAFNPDEEIGMGAHHFDVEKFGCQWAYTVDGGDEGELEYENFNAASAKIAVRGLSVHPGYAKGKMVNANMVAMEFANALPDERPETTEGYEGFFHLLHMDGGIENAHLHYIIRDHDREKFENRKALIQKIAEQLNEKYGEGTVVAEVCDQYYNMKEKIDPQKHVIDIVMKAMKDAGVTPEVKPIRGGTDGAQLSFMGLPCPNIFAGGVNFHGPYEFVSIQTMNKAMQTIIKIAEETVKYKS